MKPETAGNGRENRGLTPRQDKVALSLATGCALAVAARESGAGERTIRTWTATVPAFTRRIHELRAEMTSQALGRLTADLSSAADTLGYLSRRAKSETVRLGAARALLELGNKLRESNELEQRIAALEANQSGPGRRTA
jgi:hypothetical protein